MRDDVDAHSRQLGRTAETEFVQARVRVFVSVLCQIAGSS